MARMKKEKSENVQVGWIGSPTEWQTPGGIKHLNPLPEPVQKGFILIIQLTQCAFYHIQSIKRKLVV